MITKKRIKDILDFETNKLLLDEKQMLNPEPLHLFDLGKYKIEK